MINMKLSPRKSIGNPGGAGGGGGKDDEEDDTPLVCPKADDESHNLCKMAYSNVSVQCLLSGWSSLIPIKFFNLNPTTQLGSFYLPDTEDINPKAKVSYESRDRISLRQLRGLVGVQKQTCHPIYVQVVAKRKIDVIPHGGNKILILPLLVVADSSGYCVLSAFNEAMAVIYNGVDVGDFLLISSCEPKPAYKDYHRGLFADDMHLDLEIKLQFHSVRNHFRNKFNPRKISDFKFPLALFGSKCGVRTPAEIEEEMISSSTSESKFFDVVGVISYVGRLQRFQISEPMVVEDDHFVSRHIPRFIMYRWIAVIDKTAKAIPVKIIVHKPTFDCQKHLVPGAIVVIPYCSYLDDSFTARKYVATSEFTEIYVDSNLLHYFMMRPKSYIDKCTQVISRANYAEIMSRKDVTWAVGGTITLKASSEDRMLATFRQKELTWHNIVSLKSGAEMLKRRESRYLHAVGTIYKVTHYFAEDNFKVVYVHPRYVQDIKNVSKEHRLCAYDFSFTSKHVHWYSFMRKLPPFDEKLFEEEKCNEMSRKIVAANQKYCKPLLMPAEMETDPRVYPPAADLEMVDGPPFLYLDIFDDQTESLYRCMWKSSDYTCDEMLEKTRKAREKKIVCCLDAFCIEKGFPLEVNILDFAVIPC